jgi:hypothetical protein
MVRRKTRTEKVTAKKEKLREPSGLDTHFKKDTNFLIFKQEHRETVSIKRLCLKSTPPQPFFERESSDYKQLFSALFLSVEYVFLWRLQNLRGVFSMLRRPLL